MTDDLVDPPDAEELFEYRSGSQAGTPPQYHPYLQGDFFTGIPLPGVAEGSDSAGMIFMHPCTMRRGAKLKPAITMVEVMNAEHLYAAHPERWRTYYSGMRVTGFDGTEVPQKANFLHLATVPSSELSRAKRVATLSPVGRLVFQQRIIFHLTRFAPALAVLERATESVELELEFQSDWMRAYAATIPDDEAAIAVQEEEFDRYMGSAPSFDELLAGGGVPAGSRRDLLAIAPSELRRELAVKLPW